MKRIISLFAVVLFTASIFAQAPDRFSYQAVVRNASGVLVQNHLAGMRISILQGSISGTVVYSETFTATTNANGLVTVMIGNGTIITGSFSDINWASGPYFIETETDPSGGTNYSISGVSQLLSVPYALYAKTAEMITGGLVETDPIFNAHVTSDITINNISNWNTAFSWGNHATQGYLTSFSETDPIFNAHVVHGITQTKINNWDAAYSWGNHAGLYHPIGYVPTWSEITNKPSFASVALSGSFVDLTNKPSSIAGYGIIDAMSTSHAANAINATEISHWNISYGWGNHAGLYKLISYVPAWSEIINKPIFASVATSGNYNDLSNKLTAGNGISINQNNVISTTINQAEIQYIHDLYSSGITVEDLEILLGKKVKDYDGNVYETVKIGDQIWMAENLRTTHLNNGVLLTSSSMAIYNDDNNNLNTYGRLYVQNTLVCPTDWHLPSEAEFVTLINYLGGSDVAGGKLKEIGFVHWSSPNTGATDEVDFSALPGGMKYSGGYANIGIGGYFWSSSSEIIFLLWYNNDNITQGALRTFDFASVRCIKD